MFSEIEDAAGVKQILGLRASNSLELVRLIQRGFSFEKLERVRRETGYPLEVLAASIGISPRTLSRRKKGKKVNTK